MMDVVSRLSGSNYSPPCKDNRTTRWISPVPFLIQKFRLPPKPKNRRRNSSLFRWTNRRNKEADQLMSWSDVAPLYGYFGTDWAAMEATMDLGVDGFASVG